MTSIAGGMPAWAAAGFPVYKGVNVPSKTLGELAEQIWHPSMITPEQHCRLEGAGPRLRASSMRARPTNMRRCGCRARPACRTANWRTGCPSQPGRSTARHHLRGPHARYHRRHRLRLAGYEEGCLALENGTQGWALAGEQR
jgi:hypothetical protein